GIVFSAGEVVAGRFEVVETLGGGGMGLVYRVRDTLMSGREKALKVILPSLMNSDRARERFVQEAEIAQGLAHPNIVNTFDLGEHQGIRFITMELLEGRSLHEHLQARKKLPLKQTAGIIRQVCIALDYAHRTTIHRDIKPQNIFLCKAGTVKLLDFGLARAAGSNRFTQSSMAVGTAVYLAPEQLQGHEPTPRSDLYSLGVVLYQCLTGELPMGRFALPTEVDKSLPEAMDELVDNLLKPQPELRPDTAAQVAGEMASITREVEHPREGERTREPEETGQTTKAQSTQRTHEEAQREGERTREPIQREPQAGEARQVDLGNGVNLDLVWIPPGEFLMGSLESEEGRGRDEGPQHRVEITRGFWMGKHEVTQAQWEAVMGNNPSYFQKKVGTGWISSRRDTQPTHPVESVSWNDCQAFIKKLNSRVSGGGFRLPTEAQWEYACRAGTTTAYYFGDDAVDLGAYAWYGDNSGGETHPADRKRPNAWCLHDMHGNVWEWCSDYYDSDYYNRSPGRDPENTAKSDDRVLRGGSWSHYSRLCRSALRFGYLPVTPSIYWGFRVVLSPPRTS
ncbi:MAG: bifunctional serine/threonine-protein kinase/formylglycine-generating enzyme family protein, partial [Candidatus Hydrogenedentota bacterium]